MQRTSKEISRLLRKSGSAVIDRRKTGGQMCGKAIAAGNKGMLERTIGLAPAVAGVARVETMSLDEFNSMVAGGKINGLYLDADLIKEITPSDLQNLINGLPLDASRIFISSRTREELENILKEIAATLDEIKRYDLDEAFRMSMEAGYRAKLSEKLSAQISALPAAIRARKEAIGKVYNNMPMVPGKANIQGKRFAMATTEKMAMSNPFFGDNMLESQKAAGTAGCELVNCFIYGDMFKNESDARAFIAASGYQGNISDIRFIKKTDQAGKTLPYNDILAEVARAAGVEDQKNIGISTEASELGKIVTKFDMAKGEKVLAAKELDMNGVKVVPAINSYQTLFMMLTSGDLLTAGAVLPPGVTYNDKMRIFMYLPKVLPIDYGKEVETYRNAVRLIRTAA